MSIIKITNPTVSLTKTIALDNEKSFLPEICWPSIKNNQPIDLSTFPDLMQQKERRYMKKFWDISPSFEYCMLNAQNHILLIDSFIFKVEDTTNKLCFFKTFEKVFNLTSVKEIKILSSRKKGFDDQLVQLKNLQMEKRGCPPNQTDFTIECRQLASGHPQMPHDRFAIIDDELWHWGANVGGTHHEVNAFTRGWSAIATGAIAYFNSLWNKADRI